MKLTVNKNEAKMLEDITIIEDRKDVAVGLYGNIQHVVVGYEGVDKSYNVGTIMTSKEIVVGYTNGELCIGMRNRYGNGYRAIPVNALETLLWNNDSGLENVKILKENREEYKVV